MPGAAGGYPIEREAMPWPRDVRLNRELNGRAYLYDLEGNDSQHVGEEAQHYPDCLRCCINSARYPDVNTDAWDQEGVVSWSVTIQTSPKEPLKNVTPRSNQGPRSDVCESLEQRRVED